MTDRIEQAVELRADPARVWRALTDHEEFGAWFRVRLDGPFVVGDRATGRINHPGYEHLNWEASVVAMEPERRFVFTWRPYPIDLEVNYSQETPTMVEFRLEPHGSGTRLTVTESGFEGVGAARRAEAFRMNRQGWAAQVENIELHVDS